MHSIGLESLAQPWASHCKSSVHAPQHSVLGSQGFFDQLNIMNNTLVESQHQSWLYGGVCKENVSLKGFCSGVWKDIWSGAPMATSMRVPHVNSYAHTTKLNLLEAGKMTAVDI